MIVKWSTVTVTRAVCYTPYIRHSLLGGREWSCKGNQSVMKSSIVNYINFLFTRNKNGEWSKWFRLQVTRAKYLLSHFFLLSQFDIIFYFSILFLYSSRVCKCKVETLDLNSSHSSALRANVCENEKNRTVLERIRLATSEWRRKRLITFIFTFNFEKQKLYCIDFRRNQFFPRFECDTIDWPWRNNSQVTVCFFSDSLMQSFTLWWSRKKNIENAHWNYRCPIPIQTNWISVKIEI